MKFTKYGFLIILGLFFMLVLANKGLTENMNNSGSDRVIFEQPISYDDVLKMKEKVEQLEKEQKEKNPGAIDPMGNSNSSDENSKMLIMLKALLSAMGIDAPEDMPLPETDNAQSKDTNNFKQWGAQHNWKGLSIEQR
ncbi:MAG: hypothetical protein V1747_04270 [Candidatus Omnitrophota bacterium]